jgi:hypothetical protein
MAEADRLAGHAGNTGLCLIVADTKTGAHLYERHGYREAARCKMVKESGSTPAPTEWC